MNRKPSKSPERLLHTSDRVFVFVLRMNLFICKWMTSTVFLVLLVEIDIDGTRPNKMKSLICNFYLITISYNRNFRLNTVFLNMHIRVTFQIILFH